jgi:tRNA pseudouridine38-40 synthase
VATWKMTIEYDGTRYYGWQEQKNSRTVAGELRSAAENLFSAPVEIKGAGRTDAGVHALGQVARLRTHATKRRSEILHGLNDRLPPDINILSVEEAPHAFDPRRDAVARFYLYQISTRRTAFGKRFVWWVKDKLDEAAMETAARSLSGRHDFRRFADKRTDDGSTIVVINEVEFSRDGDLLLLRIGASHFLWKMVRRIVGTLVEVGRGSLGVAEFVSLVGANHNASVAFDIASHTAPPSGLFLERVLYDKSEKIELLAPALPVRRLKGEAMLLKSP